VSFVVLKYISENDKRTLNKVIIFFEELRKMAYNGRIILYVMD